MSCRFKCKKTNGEFVYERISPRNCVEKNEYDDTNTDTDSNTDTDVNAIHNHDIYQSQLKKKIFKII